MSRKIGMSMVSIVATAVVGMTLVTTAWAEGLGEDSRKTGNSPLDENCPCTESERSEKGIDVSDVEKKPESDTVVAPASKGA